MLDRGRILRVVGVLFGCLVLSAAGPSVEAMKAGLAGLSGQARLGALLDLTNRIEAGYPQDGLRYAAEGLALAIREGDKEKEAAFLSSTAYCYSQTGHFSEAIDYGKRALDLGTQIGNRERVAKAHNTLGITYTFIGAYSQALEECFEALRIREALGLQVPINQSLNNIGVVYHHSGQYEKAIGYFEQILQRIDPAKDTTRLILTKLNMGFAQDKLGRLQEALRNHHEALALILKAEDRPYLAYAYLNLGMTYTDLRVFPQAVRYLRLARAEYQKEEQHHGLLQVSNSLARMYLLNNDWARGIAEAKAAVALATRINARDEVKTSYELLSDLNLKLGRVDEALRCYKLAVEAKDSLFSVQESNKLAEAAMKIVTLKRDMEIQALRKDQLASALKLAKERYLSAVLIPSLLFVLALAVLLAIINRKMRENRKLVERSNLDLATSNAELQEKINEIKTLSGLLPICARCKQIRDDQGYWNQLEGYISKHTSATFSHGICPNCADDLYPEAMDRLRRKQTPWAGPEPGADPV